MFKGCAPVLLSFVLLAGCGGGSPVSSGPFDFAGFEAEVRAAVASAGNRHCAIALPSDVVALPAAAENRIRAFVAEKQGAAPGDTELRNVPCGGGGQAPCARRFEHDVWAWDGETARVLLPSAETVEREAASVRQSFLVSSVDGASRADAVAIHGLRDGRILGLVFFVDLPPCP